MSGADSIAHSAVLTTCRQSAAAAAAAAAAVLGLPPPISHMFHQANLATGRGNMPGGKSLLQLWVERVLNAFSALVAWPVESLRMDSLYT
jgi:hypothetical protein